MSRPRQARRPQTAAPAPQTSTQNVLGSDPASDAPHLDPAAVRSAIVPIADYQPHPRNYNRHPERQLEAIAASLRTFGQPRPVAVWRNYILAGHGVVEAAKRIGWTTIRADILPDDYPEHLALAYVAADNELARLSDPDEAALAAILQESRESDPALLAAMGYSAAEFAEVQGCIRRHPAPPGAGPMTTPGPATEWAAVPAIVDQLSRLDDMQHGQKMKATILELVAARVSNRSEETVWKLPDTCNRATYHSKWKNNPTFADVLKRVTAAARHYKDTEGARAVAKAAERLALASPAAAARLAGLLQSDDETVVRLAAVNILDRAGLETASKTQQQQIGSTLEEWRQDAERRRQQVDDMIAEMEDADEESDPQEEP